MTPKKRVCVSMCVGMLQPLLFLFLENFHSISDHFYSHAICNKLLFLCIPIYDSIENSLLKF